ncbi:unnamed protein product [Rotaria sp. Silwood1]|nr:unnamed protein product [Rotaria sp. Silwood1]
MLKNLLPNPVSRNRLEEQMKSTMSSPFLCIKGSYDCRDHYIVPVDSPFGIYILDHCCFVPYIDLLKDEQAVHHLRQTLNDLIEKIRTSEGFNTPNGSCMPTFDDSDLNEYGDDDVDYSQVTHGGMLFIHSTMEMMNLFKWNFPPPDRK